ncbi:MAG: RNA methyltransferase [Deltaproteobacteria bacterium]|nr:RNA methyltransferase [Deltaproteobacteria bacterium]
MGRFSLALVHHPVLHKDGSTIASAVTNTDLHDIARSCATFGVDAFYVVTPVAAQRALCDRLVHHWTVGDGARKNADRARAFAAMRVVDSITAALEMETRAAGRAVPAWATSARPLPGAVPLETARRQLEQGADALLLLGTAHGLAQPALDLCALTLAPIPGRAAPDGTRYNHLSVRAAAAILLHQLRRDS